MMSTMESVYLICFFTGFGFAVLCGLFSGLFGHGGHGDTGVHGDASFDHGHGEVSGGGLTLMILSPVTLSMLVASFGGVGIILLRVAHLDTAPWYEHVPIAAASAIAISTAVGYLFYGVVRKLEGRPAPGLREIVSLEAQVVVTIPKGGVGQIAFSLRGSHQQGPARCESSQEIKSGSRVKIVGQAGGAYLVESI